MDNGTKKLNRREFLRLAAAGTAGAAVLGPDVLKSAPKVFASPAPPTK
jgi:hypothetical protein